jgi:VWFA-related protein
MGRAARSITSVVVAVAFAGAQQDAVFRADVLEVRVDVQVATAKKTILGLDAADFLLFDEEQPQEILRFGRETDPLALVLLLDISGSMRKYARQMAGAARGALSHLKPGDEVALMVFARDVELVTEFTTRFEDLGRDIELGVDTPLPTGTAIYSSVLAAARYLETYGRRRPELRRSILILTDNESLNYQINDQQVMRALFSADAVLNAIVTSKTARPKPRPMGEYRNPDFTPTDIFRIAEESGGEAYRVERADKVFPLLIERLRTRYSLTFSPPPAPPDMFRKIRVELTPDAKKKNGNPTVRARGGYYTASK